MDGLYYAHGRIAHQHIETTECVNRGGSKSNRGGFLTNIAVNDLELVPIARLAFREFRGNVGAAEHGDYTVCFTLQILLGNGRTNS
jgi:hypothetical protein